MPDAIDPKFDGLVRELRATPPEPPPALRERVREIAARPALPQRRLRLGWVLAPAAAAIVAGAVAVGVRSSGSASNRRNRLATPARPGGRPSSRQIRPGGRNAPGRRWRSATDARSCYAAEITLRVTRSVRPTRSRRSAIRRGLSAATSARRRLRRGPRGAVRRDLAVRSRSGAYRQAIVRFSQLGTSSTSTCPCETCSPGSTAASARIAELRRSDSDAVRRPLEPPHRPSSRRCRRRRRSERRQASFATVSLHLRTLEERRSAILAPPGRIERAFEQAGDVLAAEARSRSIYAAVVAAPFVLAAAALFALMRAARRRSDRRLLGA